MIRKISIFGPACYKQTATLETEKNIKYITMKLDENERSTQIRLMKVKDMMLEEAHGYSKK